MCTPHVLSIFVYFASWTVILYYMVNRNMRHIMHMVIPVLLIILNGILIVHVKSSCPMNRIADIGTEAVLLFMLMLNILDYVGCAENARVG